MKFNLVDIWYQKSLHPITLFLLPLSWLFSLCVFLRRGLYRSRLLKTSYFSPPVIVVGNITLGGTGKTPFVIALAKFLQSQGYRPGIVSRGVGGRKHIKPYWVTSKNSPREVGDEAILLIQNTQCPLVIAKDRAQAVYELLTHSLCNIVICDDGLQHYSLDRDIEIVMVDHLRRFGNGCLLPAGPLREKKRRAKLADFIVVNGGNDKDEYSMELEPLEFVSLINSSHRIKWHEFPRKKIHAVAGIGHPQRFFSLLKNAGFNVITHPYPDHHLYQSSELDFFDDLNVIMTEKDAIKCLSFADNRYWYLRITAKMNARLEEALLDKVKNVEKDNEYKNDLLCDAKYLTHDG